MSDVSRTDLISFIAGSFTGNSPVSVEDAVAAALRLVDEFADHGWIVIDDESPLDDDDIKIEFDPAVVPRWLEIGGKRYDVVESPAEELARRFDEQGAAEHYRDAEPVGELNPDDAARLADAVAEPEVATAEIVDEEVETVNDTMVGVRGSGDEQMISWVGIGGVSRETALRHAAWIVVLADPLDERFPIIKQAVMST